MGHPKNNFPMTTVPWSLSLAVLLVFACGLASSSSASAEDVNQLALKLRQNTVRVSASSEGFGFITGERGGFLYIATAKHVLGKDTPDSPMPKKATVTFYSQQGETFDAEVLNTFEGDLAVLKVKKPPNFQWIRACMAGPESESYQTEVWYVGRQQRWYVPPKPGSISSEQVSAKWEIEFEGLTVVPGTSGAPLISPAGIVGMIREDAADTTRALVIDSIQRSFKGWNHPWELTRFVVEELPSGPDETNEPVPLILSRRSQITLRYPGNPTDNLYGCQIRPTFNIGDVTVIPTSNPYTVSNVPSGKQDYTVNGEGTCLLLLSSCRLSGQGQVFIQDGGVYDIVLNGCTVILTGP